MPDYYLYDNIPEALLFASALGTKGHSYIVNIRGPEEVIASRAAAIQVVPATAILGNGDQGLAIHLAFDSLSDTDLEFFRFLGTKVSRMLESLGAIQKRHPPAYQN